MERWVNIYVYDCEIMDFHLARFDGSQGMLGDDINQTWLKNNVIKLTH